MRTRLPVSGFVVAVLALASCATGDDGRDASRSPTTSPSTTGTTTAPDTSKTPDHKPSGGPRTDRFDAWWTYHRTPGRSGHTRTPVPTPLTPAWQKSLDGAVYGEPLVVGDSLVVATERNSVYGLDAATGEERWHLTLGTPVPLSTLPCGNIDPLGITGTPAYDASTGSVFVVAETTGGVHTLWAIDATDGTKRWQRSLDVLPDRNRNAEQQRSALLVTGGRVIAAFGGLAGDCDNYVGYLTSVPVTGQGPTQHFAVPTSREAGIWATPGPVEGANGHVYVAVGNGAELSGDWDSSDSVLELTPDRLRLVNAFAPSTWPEDNQADLDLGSSSPVPVGGRIVIAGKRGTVYLLPSSLGGVGGELDAVDGCTAFGGAARTGTTVLMPCLGETAIRALHVGRQDLQWGWTAEGIYGSPVIAGERVYVADRDTGDLVVLELRDGTQVQRLHAGSLTHFPSATVSGGMVFVPTLTGVSAFAGG